MFIELLKLITWVYQSYFYSTVFLSLTGFKYFLKLNEYVLIPVIHSLIKWLTLVRRFLDWNKTRFWASSTDIIGYGDSLARPATPTPGVCSCTIIKPVSRDIVVVHSGINISKFVFSLFLIMMNFQSFFLVVTFLKKTLLGNVFGRANSNQPFINKKITDKTKLNL